MTHDELKKWSHGVHYEANMLRRVAELLSSGRGVSADASDEDDRRVIRNALVESFLVHLRLLWDFFQWERGRTQPHRDVLVSHFLPDYQCREAIRNTPNALDENLRRRINSELAHLSQYRFQMEKKLDWQLVELYNAVHDAIQEFQSALPEDIKADNWTTYPIPPDKICTSSTSASGDVVRSTASADSMADSVRMLATDGSAQTETADELKRRIEQHRREPPVD